MVITQIVKVGFDPISEYQQMLKFEREHPDYKKQESTFMFVFVKEETYSVGKERRWRD